MVACAGHSFEDPSPIWCTAIQWTNNHPTVPNYGVWCPDNSSIHWPNKAFIQLPCMIKVLGVMHLSRGYLAYKY